MSFLMTALAPFLLSLQAAAPTPPSPPPVPAEQAAEVKVRLDTAAGSVTIAVDTARAPQTAANFLKYVDARRLDGIAFYRAVKVGDGTGLGLVQFGTRNDPKRTFPPVPHEPTAVTGLHHTDGAISMAMAKPGTAAGDFFVVVGDITSMDSHDADPGFAVFGRVVDGMDVIRRVLVAPTSPTQGEGVMRGQMLDPTIRIVSARRLP